MGSGLPLFCALCCPNTPHKRALRRLTSSSSPRRPASPPRRLAASPPRPPGFYRTGQLRGPGSWGPGISRGPGSYGVRATTLGPGIYRGPSNYGVGAPSARVFTGVRAATGSGQLGSEILSGSGHLQNPGGLWRGQLHCARVASFSGVRSNAGPETLCFAFEAATEHPTSDYKGLGSCQGRGCGARAVPAVRASRTGPGMCRHLCSHEVRAAGVRDFTVVRAATGGVRAAGSGYPEVRAGSGQPRSGYLQGSGWLRGLGTQGPGIYKGPGRYMGSGQLGSGYLQGSGQLRGPGSHNVRVFTRVRAATPRVRVLTRVRAVTGSGQLGSGILS